MNLNKLISKNLFLALAIVSLVVGLAIMLLERTSFLSVVEGIAKGCAGVFFILYYIFMLMGDQPTDETTH